jgi:hypothetical protein
MKKIEKRLGHMPSYPRPNGMNIFAFSFSSGALMVVDTKKLSKLVL